MIDGATPLDLGRQRPVPGSISVCCYCLEVSFYGDDLTLRPPLPGELEGLPPEAQAEIDKARKVLLRVQQKRELERRLIKLDDATPEQIVDFERLLREGRAATIGQLVSAGPPPRRMRPAVKRTCSECRKPIWVSNLAPARGRAACVGCAARMLDEVTRGGA